MSSQEWRGRWVESRRMNMYHGWGRVLFSVGLLVVWALALYVPIVLIGRNPSGAVFKLWLMWSIGATGMGLNLLKLVWLESTDEA